MNSFDKIINWHQTRKLSKIVSKIDAFELDVTSLSYEKIQNKFQDFKQGNNKPIQNIGELAFILALIKEVFKREKSIIPYSEQFICALSLYFGYITEMKTGEGKSIAAAIASILFSLHGKVHIATVNDYLAERDYESMAKIYEKFGLTCGANNRDDIDKNQIYNCDILYSSSMELIFDYLRNELLNPKEKMSFPFDTVIIDEIDFVLLDNANSMFSISTGLNYTPGFHNFHLAKEIYNSLRGAEASKEEYFENNPDPDAHYVYFSYNKTVYLTEMGLSFIEKVFNIDNLASNNISLYKAIINMLEANLFYINGRDYIVQDNKVILVNQVNGRLMVNSQLDSDLQSAIEIKENLNITEKPLLSNSLSYQMFFIKYKNMVGMSGTVYEAKDEFEKLFKTPVIVISTHKSNRRTDHPDLVFKTLEDKYDYLINYILNLKKKGQPILIISSSERESESLYNLFIKNNIKANLLNAQNTKEEAELIKIAGRHNQITISTNISGRGTDIVLDDEAKNAGGLRVFILNHHESKRVDNQARGRAGRQGDLGECIFLISLDDGIWKHADEIQRKEIDRLEKGIKEPLSIDKNKRLSSILDKLQTGLGANFFTTRQILFSLDGIIEYQRNQVIEWKGYLKSCSVVLIFEEYLSSKEYNQSQFESFWNEKSSYSIDFANLYELIKNKSLELGENISDLLFEQLVDGIIEKEWLIYKRDLEYIRSYLSLYRLDEEHTIGEYSNICFEQFKKFRQTVMNNLLGYFLTAQIQK